MKGNKMYQYSSIGRPLDFSYPSNRFIIFFMLLAILTGVFYQLTSGAELFQSLRWGLLTGLAVFLSWALSRELDPDYSSSAYLAAGVCFLGIFILGLPSLGVVFWLLILLRILIQSTGLSATSLDLLVLFGISCWLALEGLLELTAIGALALLMDHFGLERDYKKVIFAVLSMLFFVAIITQNPLSTSLPEKNHIPLFLSLAAGLLFFPIILRSRRVSSICDQTEDLIQPLRVQISQGFALFVGIITASIRGFEGLINLIPLWSALIGSLLYFIGQRLAISPRS